MRRYLLDICAISDAGKNVGLDAWLAKADVAAIYLSVVTLAEVGTGTELLPKGRRRSALEEWFATLIESQRDRVLPVDGELIQAWSRVRAVAKRIGNNADELDLAIAATALHHGLTIVSRNVKHFHGLAPVHNPWT